jgi:hypothetical protein
VATGARTLLIGGFLKLNGSRNMSHRAEGAGTLAVGIGALLAVWKRSHVKPEVSGLARSCCAPRQQDQACERAPATSSSLTSSSSLVLRSLAARKSNQTNQPRARADETAAAMPPLTCLRGPPLFSAAPQSGAAGAYP